MKNYFIFLFFLFLLKITYAQKNIPYFVDKSKPENVVNAIFYAAKNDDLKVLEGLCDPYNMGDDDTKMICFLCDTFVTNDSMVYDFIAESGSKYDNISLDTVRKEMKEFLSSWKADFIKLFAKGKIIGETKYTVGIENFPNIPSAFIPIQYNDIQATVILIKRNEQWYLIGL